MNVHRPCFGCLGHVDLHTMDFMQSGNTLQQLFCTTLLSSASRINNVAVTVINIDNFTSRLGQLTMKPEFVVTQVLAINELIRK